MADAEPVPQPSAESPALSGPSTAEASPYPDSGRGGWAPLRGARAAFVFFSRVPVGGVPYAARDWHWAPAHLPVVGIVVGGLSAGVCELGALLGLGPVLRACLATALSVWLTGALHEDGLADSADALGGAHGDRRRALEIMKDSRIGTYGAAALAFSLMARTAALAELPAGSWFSLIHVHAWARVVPVWLLRSEPYVNDRPDAKSQGLFATRTVHVLVALGWSVAAAAIGVALGWLPASAALAGALAPLALTPLLARYFRRRLGGVTGDLLGAAEQVAELAAWIALSAALAA
jgi:adenosylcobinamide-GDP ribazoletransferase